MDFEMFWGVSGFAETNKQFKNYNNLVQTYEKGGMHWLCRSLPLLTSPVPALRSSYPFLPFSLFFMGLFGSFRFSLAVRKQVTILSIV